MWGLKWWLCLVDCCAIVERSELRFAVAEGRWELLSLRSGCALVDGRSWRVNARLLCVAEGPYAVMLLSRQTSEGVKRRSAGGTASLGSNDPRRMH